VVSLRKILTTTLVSGVLFSSLLNSNANAENSFITRQNQNIEQVYMESLEREPLEFEYRKEEKPRRLSYEKEGFLVEPFVFIYNLAYDIHESLRAYTKGIEDKFSVEFPNNRGRFGLELGNKKGTKYLIGLGFSINF
jgi:hypothetical protein